MAFRRYKGLVMEHVDSTHNITIPRGKINCQIAVRRGQHSSNIGRNYKITSFCRQIFRKNEKKINQYMLLFCEGTLKVLNVNEIIHENSNIYLIILHYIQTI